MEVLPTSLTGASASPLTSAPSIIQTTQTVAHSALVKLNVSGTRFTTTKATLTKQPGTFFATLLEGRVPTLLDEEGAIFIDRPPKPFAVLLAYLQTGYLNKRSPEIEIEADYYQIRFPKKEFSEEEKLLAKEQLSKRIPFVLNELDKNGENGQIEIPIPESLMDDKSLGYIQQTLAISVDQRTSVYRSLALNNPPKYLFKINPDTNCICFEKQTPKRQLRNVH